MTWAASEVITGAPPGADTAPNSTPPAAGRIIRSPKVSPKGGNPVAALFCVGGTSIPVTVWVRNLGHSAMAAAPWIQVEATVTVAPGAMSYVGVPSDADLFFQNGTAVGAVTARGAGFV